MLVPFETHAINCYFQLELSEEVRPSATIYDALVCEESSEKFFRRVHLTLKKREEGGGGLKAKQMFSEKKEWLLRRKTQVDVAMQYAIRVSLLERLLYIFHYL